MTDAKNENSADPMTEFDETNGVVDGLGGDDDGAQQADRDDQGGMLNNLLGDIENALPGNRDNDLAGDDRADGRADADEGREAGYSEEGRA